MSNLDPLQAARFAAATSHQHQTASMPTTINGKTSTTTTAANQQQAASNGGAENHINNPHLLNQSHSHTNHNNHSNNSNNNSNNYQYNHQSSNSHRQNQYQQQQQQQSSKMTSPLSRSAASNLHLVSTASSAAGSKRSRAKQRKWRVLVSIALLLPALAAIIGKYFPFAYFYFHLKKESKNTPLISTASNQLLCLNYTTKQALSRGQSALK